MVVLGWELLSYERGTPVGCREIGTCCGSPYQRSCRTERRSGFMGPGLAGEGNRALWARVCICSATRSGVQAVWASVWQGEGGAVGAGGDDGELRPWQYICVYSIESRLIMSSKGATGPPPGKRAPRVGISTTVFGVRTVLRQPMPARTRWSLPGLYYTPTPRQGATLLRELSPSAASRCCTTRL